MGIVLILENITNKIVVFIEFGEIIMPTTVDAYESDLRRVYFLQSLAMPDGNQAILCAVNNIGVAINMTYPFVCA